MNSSTPGASAPHAVSQCLISFGSNLGQRASLLAEAASLISRSNVVRQSGNVRFATSRLFETPPIGGPGGQEPFLNAVASFETDASAHEVLGELQSIEERLGRKRRRRWDARSIDLDVVLHGQLMGGGSALTVPHPRYTARQFVLQPACDVAADYFDPRFGWSIAQMASHISSAVPSMALVGGDLALRQTICQRLRDDHGVRTFSGAPVGPAMSVIGNAPDVSQHQAQSESLWEHGEPIVDTNGTPWVAAYLPALPVFAAHAIGELPESTRKASVPRLIVRIQSVMRRDSSAAQCQSDPSDRNWATTKWPAPHQIWPSGWSWPEYRLEIDDLEWSIGELASALESMRCPVVAVTQNGRWW